MYVIWMNICLCTHHAWVSLVPKGKVIISTVCPRIDRSDLLFFRFLRRLPEAGCEAC